MLSLENFQIRNKGNEKTKKQRILIKAQYALNEDQCKITQMAVFNKNDFGVFT
jgi:hypothetical protein